MLRPASAPTRRVALVLTTALAAAGAVAGPAAAASLPKTPTISSVSPMKAAVGQQLTIRGKNFIAGKNRNTVVFKRNGAVAVFAKASSSSRTKLVVTIPNKLLPYFPATKAGQPAPAKFRIRVIAKRFGKGYTTLKRSPEISPVLTPAPGATGATPAPMPAVAAPLSDCDQDGILDIDDADDDNDYLADGLEASIRTNPCRADSDEDSVTDGFEYVSALDLNDRALPYPGKRPYPNPLDKSDVHVDHDGDSLTLLEEFGAWHTFGPKSLDLNYSAGTQVTKPLAAAEYRGLPQDFNRDGAISAAELAYLDFNGDGVLSDDEKDVDGDGLSNYDETHGRLLRKLIDGFYAEGEEAGRDEEFLGDAEKKRNHLAIKGPGEGTFPIEFAPVDFLDKDSDGDSLVDGLDDQDHDDVSNLLEMSRVLAGGLASPQPLSAWVQPFNPCLPNPNSRTCPKYVDFEIDYAPYNLTEEDANKPFSVAFDPSPR